MLIRPLAFALASLFGAWLSAAAPVLAQQPAASSAGSVAALPNPDLGKLPAAAAAEIRQERASFDKASEVRSGEALAEAYFVLGTVYAKHGLDDVAGIAFANAAQLAPRKAGWVYAQALNALKRGKTAEGDALLERAFTLAPDDLPIRMSLANRRAAANDLERARRLVEEYTARHRDSAAVYAMQGEIALRQKRSADAISAFQQALKIDPQANRLYATLAEAQAAAGDAKAAAESRAKAGDRMTALADPIGARVLASSVPTAAPASAKANDAPKSGEPVDSPAVRALDLAAKGEHAAALREMDAALKATPNDAAMLAIRSRIALDAGDAAAARRDAEAAVAANPALGMAQLSLGMVREVGGDDAAAARAYAEALRLNPKMKRARELLGLLEMRGGRYDAALGHFKAALADDPSDVFARAYAIASQSMLGRCAESLKDTNDALGKNAHSVVLLELFVRLTSTCKAAQPEERRMALDYGRTLYASSNAASAGEAYALALAANGQWDEAVKTQQAAMFGVVRKGDQAGLAVYRDVLETLQAKRLPERPWSAKAAVYRPERLTVGKPATPAAKK